MEDKGIPLHVLLVEAWVKKGNLYLLAQRSHKDDQAGGTWAVPGGKVEIELVDEIIEENLKREVREEVGIEIENPRYLTSRSFYRSSGHHVVGISFLVDYVSGEAKPLENQEQVRWVTIEEMESMTEEYMRPVIEKIKGYI